MRTEKEIQEKLPPLGKDEVWSLFPTDEGSRLFIRPVDSKEMLETGFASFLAEGELGK